MTSFKNVLIMNMKSKRFNREYYETIIATWSLNGWLTIDEVTECMSVLDEVYPVQEESITE